MKIYLVRHTEAIDYETESVRSDDLRFITPKGRKVAASIFKALKEELNDLEKIFTSPLIRAVQTAEIMALTLKYKNDVEIANELNISSTGNKVIQLLKRNSVFKSIALVGHEPMISGLVHELSDNQDPAFTFKKAGVCCIEIDPEMGKGRFEWYYNPKTMVKVVS